MTRRQFIAWLAGFVSTPALLAQVPMGLGDGAFLGRHRGIAFDSTNCAVSLSSPYTGGGDLFDCYADEDPAVTALASGTGLSGSWVSGAYRAQVAIDTFESYSVEDPITSSNNGGSGFSGAWA